VFVNSAATPENSARGKIDFGIDAPGLVRFFFGGGGVLSALALTAALVLGNPIWAIVLKVVLIIAAGYLLGMGCLMLYWSRVAKINRREDILDLVSWRGDEQVLDVGCGRGLMTIGAAKRLITGRVTGIDIWDAKDQASTSPAVVLDNARIAGVRDRVDVQTADARTLPFADQSFDVVTSHWVIHNIPEETGRNQALAEIARVLRSGGHVLLNDIEFRDAYLQALKSLGLVDCRLVFNKTEDQILGAVSFGSFRPATNLARKP
jgi:arsenite methyltransferase